MGMTNDDHLYFKNVFSNAGALDRIISFMNTTEDPAVERLLVPDMAYGMSILLWIKTEGVGFAY